ncbi:hypothetical protein WA026_008584 [Henosepilachna vigintioctopunctata]
MLDIGSGPGQLLLEVLSILPSNYKEIVCVDKELDMVNHLNTVNKDSRISCRQLNIETEALPADLKGRFDFAFSSNCLMYLQNYRQVFSNVHEMLKPKGELFFIWGKICPIHEIYHKLSRSDKWSIYLEDFVDWKSYFNNESSVDLLERICKSANLNILKVEELNDLVIEYDDLQSHMDIFDSLDHISGRIPESDLSEYKKDYHKLAMTYLTVEKIDNKQKKVKLHFPSVVLAARKS